MAKRKKTPAPDAELLSEPETPQKKYTWMEVIKSTDTNKEAKKMAVSALNNRVAYFMKMYRFLTIYLDRHGIAYPKSYHQTWEHHIGSFYPSQNATESHKATDYRNILTESFVICKHDPVCAHRFYIDKDAFDLHLFNYLLGVYMKQTEMLPFMMEHFENNDVVKKMWLYTMRQASFCTENEYVDAHGKCVCKNGKVCHEEPSESYTLDMVSFNIFFVAIIVVIVYYSTVPLSQLRIIYTNILRLRKKFDKPESRL